VPAARQTAARSSPARPAASDSVLRQIFVLSRRHLDLIRHDIRTLVVLLVLVPFISLLFAAVSAREDLVGLRLDQTQIRAELKEELRGAPKDARADYLPAPIAARLITMLTLALAQAGTFGAAYEIVKERAIYKRERAVNLKVSSYVLSKALVLGMFAVVQVLSAMFILSLRIDMNATPIFESLGAAQIEMGVTLLLAVVASIMLGLFISAVVPTADVVMYVILGQLFTQIILTGTLFPLPDSPVSRAAVSRWAVDAIGSTVGVREMNEQSEACRVIELPGGTGTEIACNEAAVSDKDLALNYQHDRRHLLTMWAGLGGHILFWGLLTTIVQATKKIE
jgi:ABC transport system ATP-binding/permease protein